MSMNTVLYTVVLEVVEKQPDKKGDEVIWYFGLDVAVEQSRKHSKPS